MSLMGVAEGLPVCVPCLCPSAGCSLPFVVVGGGGGTGQTDPVHLADGSEWQTGLDEKLWLPAALWVWEPLDV